MFDMAWVLIKGMMLLCKFDVEQPGSLLCEVWKGGENPQVRVGLETAEEGGYQRRVGQMRLLGELYNYRLVDSRTIFDTLYMLLAFGHDSPEAIAALDPPTSYFRVLPAVLSMLLRCSVLLHGTYPHLCRA